jgi:hypothetical protein
MLELVTWDPARCLYLQNVLGRFRLKTTKAYKSIGTNEKL